MRGALTVLLVVAGLGNARADDDVASARSHFKRASRLYDLRRYREAAKEFEAAYEAKDDPAFLYNIAQAYRLAGDSAEAVGAYQSYLRRAPDAPHRREVEARIAELKQLVEDQRKTQQAPPLGTHPPELPEPPPIVEAPPKPQQPPPALPPVEHAEAGHPGRTKIIAGAAVAAVGLALIGVGIAYALEAASASDQLTNPQPGQVFDPQLESDGHTYQAWSIAGFAVGGAALAAGAVVLALGVRERRAPRLALVPRFAPGMAGAALGGSF
jgi:tetratricopeptide (TPR) repeat protein